MNTRNNQPLLKVWPNMYMALDAFGNPAGALPVDPEHNPDRFFVGAEIYKAEIIDTLEKGDLRGARQDIFWKFNMEEPTCLPATQYYLTAIKNGWLFPADEFTANKAGIEMRPLDDLLEESCKQARIKWKQDYMEECPLVQYEKRFNKDKINSKSEIKMG